MNSGLIACKYIIRTMLHPPNETVKAPPAFSAYPERQRRSRKNPVIRSNELIKFRDRCFSAHSGTSTSFLQTAKFEGPGERVPSSGSSFLISYGHPPSKHVPHLLVGKKACQSTATRISDCIPILHIYILMKWDMRVQ